MKDNEYCFYKDNCILFDSKEETVEYKSEYNGVNINVARGFNISTGHGKAKPIKKIKQIEYKGILYLTNKRIIFINDSKGFDKSISALTSIQGFANSLNLQIGNKYYNFTTQTAEEFLSLFYELKLMDIEKIQDPKNFPLNVFEKNTSYNTAKEDPLYYIVVSGLIKNEGHLTYIMRKLVPVSYKRIYEIINSLIEDKIILDERTSDGNYKINISYEEWLTNRINNYNIKS